MKKQFIKNTLSVAILLGMTACSDNDGNQSINLSGQVIDGYLENALVCLDINDNDSCDAGEPSQRTNSMGEYNFQAGESDSTKYRVIAVIDKLTRDSDNVDNTELADAMYSTPPGKRLLSPLTTLVDHEMRVATSGTTMVALENKVKDYLALDAGVSLFADHVAMAKTDPKYIQVHNIARVVGKSLGEPVMGELESDNMRDILKARIEGIKTDLDGQAHFMAEIVDYDAVHVHDMTAMMAGMAHLRTELESFDVVMEPDMAAMMAGMAHLRAELEGFDAQVATGMSGMAGMGDMSGMSGMGDMSGMPGVADTSDMSGMPDSDDMSEMPGMTETPECPEGQRWYAENEIPGMMAMCM